ncbi:hypothetical protein J3R83DRAFT_10063 [Lanmaoa asiatica]|nr:hypothetical protein J3R83DRAFT_10063 [Lanmaoa asiatica]
MPKHRSSAGTRIVPVRTTRLITWLKENETARLKIFSDSTQDAKDADRKKEVSSHNKNYYYLQAARAIFMNDDDEHVQHFSQVRPEVFVKKIDHRIKEYNARLGKTGAGMTYEELQRDPSKVNLITSIVDSFPWWPELHGFWRTNPGFNAKPSVADPGQDLEGEALAIFQLGNTGSGASSANETELDECGTSDAVYSSSDGITNPLSSLRLDSPPAPIFAPDSTTMSTTAMELEGDLFSKWFNMDIDDGPVAPGPSHAFSPPPFTYPHDSIGAVSPTSLHEPGIPPTHIDEPVLSSQGDDPHIPALPRSPTRSGRGTTPFAFRGGALCIVPPHQHSRSKQITVNSDGEQNQPTHFPSDHWDGQFEARVTDDFDSPRFSPTLSGSSNQRPRRVASTPPTSAADATVSSGSRRSTTKWPRTTTATATASNFITQADELIKRGATFADRQQEEKARRREAHYHDKVAERVHEELDGSIQCRSKPSVHKNSK